MRNVVIFAVVALLIAGTASNFADRFATAARDESTGAKSTPAPAPGSANMLAVRGDRDGHFRVDATIGGRSVEFLVDTGASIVALTSRDAKRLGLDPGPSDYTARMQTANGIVQAARVQLAGVTVGPLVVHNVEAVVMPEGALAQNLLGMSFLSRLRRFEFRTGQLLLEQ